MAEKVFDIGIGTELDLDELQKQLKDGLSKAESEVIRGVQKQTEIVNKAAQKNIEIIRKEEEEKIALVKSGVQERIAAIKSMPDLSSADKQKEIKAIKEAADQEIRIIKDKAKLSEAAVKTMASNQIKTYNDLAKKQIKAMQDANKSSLKSIKEFAKGALKELLGIDQVLSAMAGGPVAIGKAFIDIGRKAVAALNDMAAAWREQEVAEVALQNAAKTNPYLSDNSVRQLNQFANEMQRVTGLDSMMITQAQTRLASFNRDQQQIQNIVKAAADMSARGIMGFDEAVNVLNKSLSGVTRGIDVLYPELKNMSKEALASGQAIEYIGQKVAGSAAEAMKTGAGSVTAYKNALGDLGKAIGEVWESIIQNSRNATTRLINNAVDLINSMRATFNWSKELNASKAFIKAIDDEISVINERIQSNEEYQHIADLWYQAAEEGNIILRDHYAEQMRLIRGTADEEIRALDVKKKTSNQYMHMLQEEMRMLEVLYLMENGGRQGKDFSIIEKRRAEAFKKEYEETTGAMLNISQQQEIIWSKIQQANYEIEMKQNEDIHNAQIQAEQERQDTIRRFREENQKALDAEIEKIYRRAELEGKSRDSLEVQKQVLDANVQAYENLLSAAKEYIDGTAPEERERFARLKASWAAYSEQAELEKRTDEERKKRFAELAKQQGDLANKLEKILEEAIAERDKLYNTQKEQAFQDELTKIRKRSAADAVNFEAEYRQRQRKIEYQNQIAKLEENHDLQRVYLAKIMEAELEAAGDNAAQREEIEQKYNDDILKLNDGLNLARQQLDANYLTQKEQAEKETAKAIEQAYMEMYQKLLSKAQEYLNAASSIASSISAIWTNNIEWEKDEKIRANNALIQSDEDRAAANEKIEREALQKNYEAALFKWSLDSTMAAAQAAMATLNALSQPPGPPATIPMSVLAAAMGAMQVAAVISARPKPPRFHTGGQVPGAKGTEVLTVQKAGEFDLTPRQFQNTMQAISNLAGTRTGTAGVQMDVKVENYASNKVSAEPKLTADGFKVVIREIVNEGFGNGSFDSGVARQQSNLRGGVVL